MSVEDQSQYYDCFSTSHIPYKPICDLLALFLIFVLSNGPFAVVDALQHSMASYDGRKEQLLPDAMY